MWFDPPSNPGSTVIMHRQPNDVWRIDYQLAPEDDAGIETQEERIRARTATPGTGRWSWSCHGGIDTVPADDREGFLARLALLLGHRLSEHDFREAVTTAASVR